MRDVQMYQIGEVAETVGLSLRTIRYYEEAGLVSPRTRTAGGFRLYAQRDIDRLLLVKQMKPLDLSLEQMRELLSIQDRLADPTTPQEERDGLFSQLTHFVALIDGRCERLRGYLAAGEELRNTLIAHIESQSR